MNHIKMLIGTDNYIAALERLASKVKDQQVLQKEFVEKMQECVENPDVEAAQEDADDLICDFLCKAGYEELAHKFLEVERWYD